MTSQTKVSNEVESRKSYDTLVSQPSSFRVPTSRTNGSSVQQLGPVMSKTLNAFYANYDSAQVSDYGVEIKKRLPGGKKELELAAYRSEDRWGSIPTKKATSSHTSTKHRKQNE